MQEMAEVASLVRLTDSGTRLPPNAPNVHKEISLPRMESVVEFLTLLFNAALGGQVQFVKTLAHEQKHAVHLGAIARFLNGLFCGYYALQGLNCIGHNRLLPLFG